MSDEGKTPEERGSTEVLKEQFSKKKSWPKRPAWGPNDTFKFGATRASPVSIPAVPTSTSSSLPTMSSG